MSSGGVRLTGAWDAYLKAMDGKGFAHRLAGFTLKAGERVGRDFIARARKAIRAGVYAPNSPVTVILKGSSKPLVDHGDLFQGITFQVVDPYNVRLGIMRARSGDKLVNIGLVLHEGATIDVKANPRVRMAVWAKIRSRVSPDALAALNARQRKSVTAAASTLGVRRRSGRAWTERQRRWWFAQMHGPKAAARDVWIIPPRPFLSSIAESADFQAVILRHYTDAIKAAFQGG